MFDLTDIEFAYPGLLWLLAVIPLMVLWYIFTHKNQYPKAKLSGLNALPLDQINIKVLFRHHSVVLRSLSFAALIVAVARPQTSLSWEDVTTEGIDIVVALDISSSMLAEDLKPNRLEAAKSVAMDFISDRHNDRIGLVIYSGESFTQCPLTTDHDVLKNLFMGIRNGMIEDGTAIGDGLATAVSRLRDSDAKSKVVILLTDGFNTAGSIPPLTGAQIAKQFGVRVYTIGVGTIGSAPYPFKTPFGTTQYQNVPVKIDEAALKGIADATGGAYFRATDNKKLAAIYQEIDQMEKSKVEVTQYRKKAEEFFPWALLATLLLLTEYVLKNTLYKSIT